MIPKQVLTLQRAELTQLNEENKTLTEEFTRLVRQSGNQEFQDVATAADMLLLLQERVEFLRQELRYTTSRLQVVSSEVQTERAKREHAQKMASASPSDLETQLLEAKRVKTALLEEYRQLQSSFGRQVRDLKVRTSQQRAKLMTNLGP